MRVSDLLRSPEPTFSFEFFPPKTDVGLARLYGTIEHLSELNPSFVSVTYGAGGSTRHRTVEIASHIKNSIGIEAVAHLTCRGHTRDEIGSTLDALATNQVDNVLALRGDPPKDVPDEGFSDFRYADELVTFIREGRPMCIGAACYPEGHTENPDLDDDLERLVQKVRAGCDFLITQLFFDNEKYFRFVDRLRAAGIDVPVLPGIMPVTNVAQLKRFTTMCGASVPDQLMERLEKYSDDEQAVLALGIEWAIGQCRQLLAGGAPGIHFYTLNRSLSTRVVCVSLQGL